MAAVTALCFVVTVGYLHWRSETTVQATELPPPRPSVFDESPTAVFVGDSFTAGSGASRPSAGFANRVAVAMEWRSTFLGEGGTGYAGSGSTGGHPYSARLDSVIGLDPDVVMFSGGLNDRGVPLDALAAAVHDELAEVVAALPDATVYVVSPISSPGAPDRFMRGVIATIQEEAAGVPGVTYLDIGQPLAGHPALIGPDGLHPNNDGHAAIAAAILAELD